MCWGEGKKQKKKKFQVRRVTEKKGKGEVKKKTILPDELHGRAYKLYLPEWQLGGHFIL